MSKDLFFVAILFKAFQSAQPDEALKQAFEKIEHLGSQPPYRQGFLQFEAFLVDVYSRHELWCDVNICELMVELATGIISNDQGERQAALEIIQEHPGWQADYLALCEMLEPGSADNALSLLEIYYEQRRIKQISLTELLTSSCTIADIEPGRYLIRLGTGLLIWSGRLSAQELIWTEAFGRQGLAVAAETGDVPQKPTSQYILLDGEMILRTYAGIEKGSIELTKGEG